MRNQHYDDWAEKDDLILLDAINRLSGSQWEKAASVQKRDLFHDRTLNSIRVRISRLTGTNPRKIYQSTTREKHSVASAKRWEWTPEEIRILQSEKQMWEDGNTANWNIRSKELSQTILEGRSNQAITHKMWDLFGPRRKHVKSARYKSKAIFGRSGRPWSRKEIKIAHEALMSDHSPIERIAKRLSRDDSINRSWAAIAHYMLKVRDSVRSEGRKGPPRVSTIPDLTSPEAKTNDGHGYDDLAVVAKSSKESTGRALLRHIALVDQMHTALATPEAWRKQTERLRVLAEQMYADLEAIGESVATMKSQKEVAENKYDQMFKVIYPRYEDFIAWAHDKEAQEWWEQKKKKRGDEYDAAANEVDQVAQSERQVYLELRRSG